MIKNYLDRKFITDIRKSLKDNSDILAAYIFGSCAGGFTNKESDLDLAIVVKDKRIINYDMIYPLLLPVKFPKNPDISIVDQNSSPLFLYEIISGGIRIFSHDEERAIAFEAEVLDKYYDTKHLRNIYGMYLKDYFTGYNYGR